MARMLVHSVRLVNGVVRASGPEQCRHVMHPLCIGDGVHVLDEVVAETPVSMTEAPGYQVDVNIQLLDLVFGTCPGEQKICRQL